MKIEKLKQERDAAMAVYDEAISDYYQVRGDVAEARAEYVESTDDALSGYLKASLSAIELIFRDVTDAALAAMDDRDEAMAHFSKALAERS